MTRSDGVPLFAEELTKAVLDLRSLDAGALPLTLLDSLMARLDRLGYAKDIAQIASVVGRQFSYRLLKAGLIFEAGDEDQSPTYSFNHSLVQEAAYESLSRGGRHDAAQGNCQPSRVWIHSNRRKRTGTHSVSLRPRRRSREIVLFLVACRRPIQSASGVRGLHRQSNFRTRGGGACRGS